MYLWVILLWLATLNTARGQPGKCDQTPPGATILTPSDSKNAPYTLKILGIEMKLESNQTSYGEFRPDQTYVLILETKNETRPFKEFMITVEDPDVDNNIYYFQHQKVDVGNLKTLDDDFKSRYSERCYSSVENKDNSDKSRIEMHWVSPKLSENGQKIRFRAMVAENKEKWYTGDFLTIILEKDDANPIDSPPVPASAVCGLCSEARYEIVFQGMWSRGTHSLHYPSQPDKIQYSEMIGASHDIEYDLWKPGAKASLGLKKLAEEADVTLLEQDIVLNMSEYKGTRTLIKGKKHKHPHMSDPSYALFRVDRFHHLFSVAIAMRPSPDWFLGTHRFELCTKEGWLNSWNLKMYPWDAGTRDGISYESIGPVTNPEDNVDRVAVGSFNRESPFYQMNLNDLHPFAMLYIKKLDEFPLIGVDCNEEGEDKEENVEEGTSEEEGPNDEPFLAESKVRSECLGEWSSWSPCEPSNGVCGVGTHSRRRLRDTNYYGNEDQNILQVKPLGRCLQEEETQACFIYCYD